MQSKITTSQIDWLNKLTESTKKVIEEKAVVTDYESDQVIYRQGADCDGMYIIIQGSVKTCSGVDEKREIIKHLMYSGEIFGESIHSEKDHRNEFAVAHSTCTIMRIPLEDFWSLLNSDTDLRKRVIHTVMERLKMLEQRINALHNKSVVDRIVNYIRYQVENRSIKIGMQEHLITNGMSLKDVALLTDTSRQTVSKVFAKLKKLDLIHFNARRPERMLIRNMNALLAM
jgi:CRP/FNR family transcriptional regulator, cyclic AMP receptor protein